MTIILETERLRLRNWRDSDRRLFAEINADPEVMEFFPFRRTRAEADQLMDRIASRIEQTGFGFYTAALKQTDEPIGFCGLALTDLEPFFADGTLEIGWRLARPYWGQGYVTEAAKALLRHGFERPGVEEIVSFAVPQNTRSTAVMKRIGMQRAESRDFDHPRIAEEQAHLRPHVVYDITRTQFAALQR